MAFKQVCLIINVDCQLKRKLISMLLFYQIYNIFLFRMDVFLLFVLLFSCTSFVCNTVLFICTTLVSRIENVLLQSISDTFVVFSEMCLAIFSIIPASLLYYKVFVITDDEVCRIGKLVMRFSFYRH